MQKLTCWPCCCCKIWAAKKGNAAAAALGGAPARNALPNPAAAFSDAAKLGLLRKACRKGSRSADCGVARGSVAEGVKSRADNIPLPVGTPPPTATVLAMLGGPIEVLTNSDVVPCRGSATLFAFALTLVLGTLGASEVDGALWPGSTGWVAERKCMMTLPTSSYKHKIWKTTPISTPLSPPLVNQFHRFVINLPLY